MRQPTVISSTSNPQVQRARKLKRRVDRDRAGAFLVEGPLGLEAALSAGLELREVFVEERALEIRSRCEELGVEAKVVTDRVLTAISDTTTPQGSVAVFSIPSTTIEDVPAGASLVLVLAEVRDPGNAGTLVRTAAAAGADAVLFTADSVDPWGPKTVRSSAGSLFALPVIRGLALREALVAMARLGLAIYLGEADKGSLATEVDLTRPSALVVGNEAHGIPGGSALEGATFVSIPMPGGTESLNVGVAGSILLYETVRQRLGTGG